MTKDENPIKICWNCKKKFDGNFAIKDLQIICPYCKKPQSSVFEKDSQAQIIKKSQTGIDESKAALKRNKDHQDHKAKNSSDHQKSGGGNDVSR